MNIPIAAEISQRLLCYVENQSENGSSPLFVSGNIMQLIVLSSCEDGEGQGEEGEC